METMKMVIPKPPSLDMANIINRDDNIRSYSNCSSPYISAPSSPQRQLNYFYSAPTSPRRFFAGAGDDSAFTFSDPKSAANGDGGFDDEEDDDFEFQFSGQLDMMVRPSLSSADELFDGGKIRPLKPPPAMMISSATTSDSPKSPISKFRDALSPRQRKKKNNNFDQDPFEAAIKTTIAKSDATTSPKFNDQTRGRSMANSRANSRKGISRSLSPLRVSEFALLHQEGSKYPPPNPNQNDVGSSSSRWGSRKWRLKDFLLFRSASEGRASTTGKDPLRKYFSLSSGKKSGEEEPRSSGSFRSVGSCSSMADGSVSRRRGQVSAHEQHYTKNRAVAEEMKKKTTLPYKHGLLGCLGFNPALHDITKAFGPFAR